MSLRCANMHVLMATVHAAQLLLCWVCSLSWIWLPRVGLSNLWWATFSKTLVALIQFVVTTSPFYCTKCIQWVLQRARMVLSAVRSGWNDIAGLPGHIQVGQGEVYFNWTASFDVSPVHLLFWFMGGTLLCVGVKSCALPCSSKALLVTGWTHKGTPISSGYFWV